MDLIKNWLKNRKKQKIEEIKQEHFKDLVILKEFADTNFLPYDKKHFEYNCWISNNFSFYCPHRPDSECTIVDELRSSIDRIQKKGSIDLKSIDSISASKSLGAGLVYNTVYDFGKKNGYSYNDALKDVEYYIKDRGMTFTTYEWNKKIHWVNSDCSHHMGSFVYHLINNNESYIVEADITECKINKDNLSNLLNKYDLFILNKNIKFNFLKCFNNYDAWEYQKKCYMFNLDEVETDNRLLLIHKDVEVNKGIVELLKRMDQDLILNVNKVLEEYL